MEGYSEMSKRMAVYAHMHAVTVTACKWLSFVSNAQQHLASLRID